MSRHLHEREVVWLCQATQASSYTRAVFRWLEQHYPESAGRLRAELQEIYNSKRLRERAAALP